MILYKKVKEKCVIGRFFPIMIGERIEVKILLNWQKKGKNRN